MLLHTHTHPHPHTRTSAAIQSLSNKKGKDAPSGLGAGGHTHCVVCNGTFLQSQARKSPSVRKCRKCAFRLPVQRQLTEKYDNMRSVICVNTGPKDKFRKKTNTFSFGLTFMSSINCSTMVEAGSPMQSPVAFFLRNNKEFSL